MYNYKRFGYFITILSGTFYGMGSIGIDENEARTEMLEMISYLIEMEIIAINRFIYIIIYKSV